MEALAVTDGTPVFLGVIAYTGSSVNNHTTGTAFNNTTDALKGKTLLIQASTVCYILPGTANDAAATTANGVKLAVDERVILRMGQSYGWLAAIRDTASGNLRVWELV